MSTSISIGGRSIGAGHQVYVIAELSANHGGSFEEAQRLVRAAKEAGADAVKLQTYTADTLTLKSDKEIFRVGKGTLWSGKTLHDLYHEAYMPWDWQPGLASLAAELGIQLFSSPFDDSAVDFLEKMNVPAYKIASFEIVDLSLIERVARTGKPVIMSTGMSTRDEIAEALGTARNAGAKEIALLKCTSAYPALPEDVNLRTITDMESAFGVPVGLSDHTLGIAVPVAAVSLGACIIEKHFTLSRAKKGPDSAFSLEPAEFAEMIRSVRTAERAIGRVNYGPTGDEVNSLRFRRSLFVVEPVKADEAFTRKNVRSIRPAAGLHPRFLKDVLGRRAGRDLGPGTPLAWDDVAGGPP